jgi:ABC-2 type transport system permease protein
MSNTLTIAGRQFRSYFNGAVAYIVLCLVMLALGFWFWKTFFLFNKATAREMFDTLRGILAFAVPALTMGLLAEEKRTGTVELLITMPVREAEVIVGKFLGVLGLFGVLLALTLPYPMSVAALGPIDWGPVFTGYLGLLLQGGAMMAIGLMTSSFTENQLIAFFAALAITVPLAFMHMLLPLFPTGATSVLEWFSFHYHFDSMARGVLDLRNVLYFTSLTIFCLMVAFRSLESRRWS